MNRFKVGKWLDCGCCGTSFQIWEGYQDQDQDDSYGICKSCQGSISEHDEQEYDKAIKVLREGLNEENRAKFDLFDRDLQKAFVCQAIEDGQMTFSVERVS